MQNLTIFVRKNNLPPQIIEHRWLKIITLKLCPSVVLISKKIKISKFSEKVKYFFMSNQHWQNIFLQYLTLICGCA
jgi:hypothetical protein